MTTSPVLSAITRTIRDVSFDNQPTIALWNLQRLAQTLSPFMSADVLNAALDSYQPVLLSEYGILMRQKLGFLASKRMTMCC
jgi:uncharacterized protein YdiU (UPF0061 family)